MIDLHGRFGFFSPCDKHVNYGVDVNMPDNRTLVLQRYITTIVLVLLMVLFVSIVLLEL